MKYLDKNNKIIQNQDSVLYEGKIWTAVVFAKKVVIKRNGDQIILNPVSARRAEVV